MFTTSLAQEVRAKDGTAHTKISVMRRFNNVHNTMSRTKKVSFS